MKQAFLCLMLMATSACVSLPATQPASGERVSAGGAGAASTPSATTILVEQSRAALAAGEYGQASVAIERALRIEPSNPYLWVELGQIHLATGSNQQAAALAKKAISLAGNDADARRAAQLLMQQAAIR